MSAAETVEIAGLNAVATVPSILSLDTLLTSVWRVKPRQWWAVSYVDKSRNAVITGRRQPRWAAKADPPKVGRPLDPESPVEVVFARA